MVREGDPPLILTLILLYLICGGKQQTAPNHFMIVLTARIVYFR